MQLQNGWVESAEHKRSPFFNDRPKQEISLIVVHNISLPHRVFGTSYIDELFTGCLDCGAHPSFSDLNGVEVSSHFLICRDGRLTQYVPIDKRAWHAGVSEFSGRSNCNDFSIGIELEGADDVPYTSEQYTALVALCQLLKHHYPDIQSNITGHSDIAPGRKTDPGDAFDWRRFWQEMDVR